MELSDDELKILKILHTDLTAMEISGFLNIPYFTVQSTIQRLCGYYRVRGRIGLVRVALLKKIITIKDLEKASIKDLSSVYA
jgi:DNA-binding CsgD family transcriptional regulator